MPDAVGFEGEMIVRDPVNAGAPDGVGLLTAKFARYPGSQQLVLWLPMDGYSGYGRFRIRGPGGERVDDAEVTERLNGRVQILIDTYAWKPGTYLVEITHREGWVHELGLEKLEEGVALPKPAPLPEPEGERPPIVYRDGTGKVLPNVDLEMRARALDRLTAKFSRRLEFEGNFRAGNIIYIEGDMRVSFWHEMCAGGIHFSIHLPVPAKWEAETKRPLSERTEIVAFVAAETQRRQASSWRYKIYEDRIDFMD